MHYILTLNIFTSLFLYVSFPPIDILRILISSLFKYSIFHYLLFPLFIAGLLSTLVVFLSEFMSVLLFHSFFISFYFIFFKIFEFLWTGFDFVTLPYTHLLIVISALFKSFSLFAYHYENILFVYNILCISFNSSIGLLVCYFFTCLFSLSRNVRKALDPSDTCIYFLWGYIFLSLMFSSKSYIFTLLLQARIVFVFPFSFEVVLFFLFFLQAILVFLS